MFQRILVPWDGSELADRALGTAMELAVGYEAEIVLASVLTADACGDGGRRLAAAFERTRVAAQRSGVPLSHQILEGRHPTDVLLDFAHEHGFDLMVIGHHRDPHPGHLVLHGVTEHLVAAAEVPILVVGGESPTASRRVPDPERAP